MGKDTSDMRIVVIDGQGGRLGQLLVEAIIKENTGCELIAIGTNSIATSAMMKAGAMQGATGENPVIVAAEKADVIIGPIGILAADSLLGEITPAMATAIGRSNAMKFLIPLSHCNNQVVGIRQMTMAEMVRETISALNRYLSGISEK